MISRRDLLKVTGQAGILAGASPVVNAFMNTGLLDKEGAVRCINVINFIRGVEPRSPIDLLLPVQKQMELLLSHQLPTTWLLQYDALVSGKFVDYLKSNMAKNHEVGFWLEMNELHVKAAGVEWRGRPGLEWDSHPPVAFTIGYTPEERIKLADAAMSKFKSIWGFHPSSVASWNLDSITCAYLVEKYQVDAFAVCRDQLATDGFTIWGAPIAGYYPSRKNCWSPALNVSEQIHAPIFRMLGQDPVYYYERGFKLPDGRVAGEPDTMEPVWTAGRNHHFIDGFLDMIAVTPTLKFAYAQLGQENNFGWDEMKESFPYQMEKLAALQKSGMVHVETMGDSGRRFKKAFKTTPAQAQIQLTDPFENTDPAEKTIWYQSKYYRANLHIKGDLPYLRDLTVYSDQNPQPFLTEATRSNDVEQRMTAVIDGFHWSKDPGVGKPTTAGGFFMIDGKRAKAVGDPKIRETGSSLFLDIPVKEGLLKVRFDEDRLSIQLVSSAKSQFAFSCEWDPSKTAFKGLQGNKAFYRFHDFDYSILVEANRTENSDLGWSAASKSNSIRLSLKQTT